MATAKKCSQLTSQHFLPECTVYLSLYLLLSMTVCSLSSLSFLSLSPHLFHSRGFSDVITGSRSQWDPNVSAHTITHNRNRAIARKSLHPHKKTKAAKQTAGPNVITARTCLDKVAALLVGRRHMCHLRCRSECEKCKREHASLTTPH